MRSKNDLLCVYHCALTVKHAITAAFFCKNVLLLVKQQCNLGHHQWSLVVIQGALLANAMTMELCFWTFSLVGQWWVSRLLVSMVSG